MTGMLWFETRAKRMLRIKEAMVDYSFYDRPHKRKPKVLHEAQENLEYFMRVRLERLALFRSWLHTHFDVDASFDSDGAFKTSRWLDRYAEGLLSSNDRDQQSFPHYSKWWTEKDPTYSVLFDLGIFVGEFVIEKRPWCRWELVQETPDKPWTKKSIAKLGPSLSFHPDWDSMNPIGIPWFVLSDKRSGLLVPRAGKGELYRWIKQFLYNARSAYESGARFSVESVDRESFERMPMIVRN
jgi:hypothetical protein